MACSFLGSDTAKNLRDVTLFKSLSLNASLMKDLVSM